MKYQLIPACLVMLGLTACSHTIPETYTKPQAPPQLGKTPPVIQPLNATQKQAQAPESLLPVTMTADLTPVQKTIQAALPERFTEEGADGKILGFPVQAEFGVPRTDRHGLLQTVPDQVQRNDVAGLLERLRDVLPH